MTGVVLILPGVMVAVIIYALVLIVVDARSGGLTAYEERREQ